MAFYAVCICVCICILRAGSDTAAEDPEKEKPGRLCPGNSHQIQKKGKQHINYILCVCICVCFCIKKPAPYQSRNRLTEGRFSAIENLLNYTMFVYVYVYVFIYGRTTSYIKSRLAALSPAPRLPLRFAVLKAPAAAGRLASGKLPRPAGSRFQWCRLDLVCGAVTRERMFFLSERKGFFRGLHRPGLAVLGSWDAVGVISLRSASGPIPPGNG